jgi:hypothetical protein
MAAQRTIAQQAGAVIREGVLDGDIISNIFFKEDFTEQSFDGRIELDLLSPGTEKEHIAYVTPDHGKIPHRFVESDYIMLNTFTIVSSIDCTLNYFRKTRFDVLRRMLEVLQGSMVKKMNDDGWQTLLAGANGRGIVVYDGDATAGQFTPKLVSLYMSPEAMEDMTAWGLNLVPESVRESVFRSSDGAVMNLFDVNFHDLDELGVGQEYQLYYTSTLSGSLGPSSDEELVVGLDLTNRQNFFVMPVEEDIKVFEDNTLHRTNTAGFYSRATAGYSILDLRGILSPPFLTILNNNHL